MILHAYGDSWTEGEGADINIENTLNNTNDKRLFRNSKSWVKSLSDRLIIPNKNNGISGNSNNKIFNQIVLDVQNHLIKSGDLIIVMWSSSLRDSVPFLPKDEWISWSVKHLLETPEKFTTSYKSNNIDYNKFLIDYKNYFILNLFNQNYYNIVNQNYIIFLQKLFQFYNINYLFCDGLESMIIDLHKKDNVTNLIKDNNYWGFKKETFRDFLLKTNRLDLWEYQDVTYKDRAKQHPNENGYNLISQELYNYIVKNNII
jgi:lysophospholipase L1-like esterase